MKHFGPALAVVEFEVELVELIAVELVELTEVELVELTVLVVTVEVEICTVIGRLWISGPLVPVTVSVKVPTLDACPAESMSVDVAEASCGGVTGLGRLNDMPLGPAPCHETDKATGELNPSCESTVITELPVDPWLIMMAVGAALTEKSGVTP